MSYRAPPTLQGSLVKQAVSQIPVVGQIIAALLPSDIGNDWTEANRIIEDWIAKQYQTRISPRAQALRMRTAARKRFLGIR